MSKRPLNTVSSLDKPSRVDIKRFMVERRQDAKFGFAELVDKFKLHRKPTRTLTRAEQNESKRRQKHAILGIWSLLVVVSIAYSTSVIFVGVGTIESKVALIPQALFGLYTLFKAFSNLHK